VLGGGSGLWGSASPPSCLDPAQGLQLDFYCGSERLWLSRITPTYKQHLLQAEEAASGVGEVSKQRRSREIKANLGGEGNRQELKCVESLCDIPILMQKCLRSMSFFSLFLQELRWVNKR